MVFDIMTSDIADIQRGMDRFASDVRPGVTV